MAGGSFLSRSLACAVHSFDAHSCHFPGDNHAEVQLISPESSCCCCLSETGNQLYTKDVAAAAVDVVAVTTVISVQSVM